MTRLALRRAGTIAAAAAIVLVLLGVPAQAVEYRYWSYWWGAAGGWSLAPAGASHPVTDGDVEGWRFGVGGVGSAPLPRAAASFSSICGGTPQAEGKVRVALVVDYGTSADAPPGQAPPRGVDTMCAVVPASNATGFAVLGQYGGVRQDRGLICAINGYPAGECAAAVEPPEPEPAPQPQPQPQPNPQPKPQPNPAPAPGSGSGPQPPSSGPGEPNPPSEGSPGAQPQAGSGSAEQPAQQGDSAGSTTSNGDSASGRESTQQAQGSDADSDGAAGTDGPTADPDPAASDSSGPTSSPALRTSPEATPADRSSAEASPTPSDDAQPLAASNGSSSSGPWVTVGVLAIAAALGGTAWWRSRSRTA